MNYAQLDNANELNAKIKTLNNELLRLEEFSKLYVQGEKFYLSTKFLLMEFPIDSVPDLLYEAKQKLIKEIEVLQKEFENL